MDVAQSCEQVCVVRSSACTCVFLQGSSARLHFVFPIASSNLLHGRHGIVIDQ